MLIKYRKCIQYLKRDIHPDKQVRQQEISKACKIQDLPVEQGCNKIASFLADHHKM